jgi:2-haloacid dehalogenase
MSLVPAPDAPTPLLFDVFGTVVDWRGSIAKLSKATFGARFAGIDWFAFADRWRGEYQNSMEPIRSGAREFVRLDVLHRENLIATVQAFSMVGLTDSDLDAGTLFWHRLDPWPDVREGMARLRDQHLICAQSNGNIRLMADLARHGGWVWDAILGAEATGQYKPEPQAYLAACEIMGLPPAGCMMVAAHNDDLEAAAACGLRTAFIKRPTEFGPDDPSGAVPTGDWDFVAEDLSDLAAQLGS